MQRIISRRASCDSLGISEMISALLMLGKYTAHESQSTFSDPRGCETKFFASYGVGAQRLWMEMLKTPSPPRSGGEGRGELWLPGIDFDRTMNSVQPVPKTHSDHYGNEDRPKIESGKALKLRFNNV